MSLWARLFGGGSSEGKTTGVEPVDHDGFLIYPEPISEGGKWRISARIEKEIDGTLQSHLMVRADTLDSAEAAQDATIAKAKMLIDQQGKGIFS